MWMTPWRLDERNNIHFSTPIMKTEFTFVAHRQTLVSATDDFNFVFSPFLHFAVFLTALVLLLLYALETTLSSRDISSEKRNYTWHKFTQSNLLIAFGLFLLMIFYSAGYKSQKLTPATIVRNLVPVNLTNQLRSKQRRLISFGIFRGVINDIFGPIEQIDQDCLPIIMHDATQLALKLCQPGNALLYNGGLIPLLAGKPKCLLREVVEDDAELVDVAYDTAYLSLAFSKTVSAKDVKKINQIIRTIFHFDTIENFFLPRYGVDLKRWNGEKLLRDRQPQELYQLGLLSRCGCWTTAASVLVLLAEISLEKWKTAKKFVLFAPFATFYRRIRHLVSRAFRAVEVHYCV